MLGKIDIDCEKKRSFFAIVCSINEHSTKPTDYFPLPLFAEKNEIGVEAKTRLFPCFGTCVLTFENNKHKNKCIIVTNSIRIVQYLGHRANCYLNLSLCNAMYHQFPLEYVLESLRALFPSSSSVPSK